MAGAEAVTVGAVNVVTGTVMTVIRGMQDVGSEIGVTAVNTVRGSLRAAEVIGNDVAKIAGNAATGALEAADRIGSATARMLRDIVAEASRNAKPGGRTPLTAARRGATANSKPRGQSAA